MAPDPRLAPVAAEEDPTVVMVVVDDDDNDNDNDNGNDDAAEQLSPLALALSPNLPPAYKHTSAEAAARFAEMLSAAFLHDALQITFTLEQQGRLVPPYAGYTTPLARITEADLVTHLQARLATKLRVPGAHIASAGDDFAAACVWEAPGAVALPPAPDPAVASARPLLAAFHARVTAARARHLGVGVGGVGGTTDAEDAEDAPMGDTPRPLLPLAPFWHMSMLARDPDPRRPRVPGAVRAIVEPYFRAALHAGVAVCMEAGSEHARDVYIHFGMEAVEEMRCGVGVVGADGYPVIAGDGREAVGVTTYLMLFNGPRQKRQKQQRQKQKEQQQQQQQQR